MSTSSSISELKEDTDHSLPDKFNNPYPFLTLDEQKERFKEILNFACQNQTTTNAFARVFGNNFEYFIQCNPSDISEIFRDKRYDLLMKLRLRQLYYYCKIHNIGHISSLHDFTLGKFNQLSPHLHIDYEMMFSGYIKIFNTTVNDDDYTSGNEYKNYDYNRDDDNQQDVHVESTIVSQLFASKEFVLDQAIVQTSLDTVSYKTSSIQDILAQAIDDLISFEYDEFDEDDSDEDNEVTIVDQRISVWNIMDSTFHIFGTSAQDSSTRPHVLTPPLMDSLRYFLPFSIPDQNFWLKYSLVRDGADLISFLHHVRGAKYSIIAIETVDGEVFGSFTSMPWHKHHNYFGTDESFLWRLCRNRNETIESVDKLMRMESKLNVYLWSGANYMVQFCQNNRIGLGGGEVGDSNANFGLALDSDLLFGTTGPCATFNNPPLAQCCKDGVFEVVSIFEK